MNGRVPLSIALLFAGCLLGTPSVHAQGMTESNLDNRVVESIDRDAGEETEQGRDSRTVLSADLVLGIGDVALEARLNALLEHLRPLLEDEELGDFLARVQPDLPRNAAGGLSLDVGDGREPGIFMQLAPVVTALDTQPLPSSLVGLLPDSLKGFSGYAFLAALRHGNCLEMALRAILGTSTPDDPDCEIPRLGKLRRWEFPDIRNTIGTPITGELFVEDMKIDLYRIVYDTATDRLRLNLVKQWSRDWAVSIVADGFTRAKRLTHLDFVNALASDPGIDPFVSAPPLPPTAPQPSLPAAMLDFFDPESIWQRNLRRRLYAHGDAVRVDSVTGTLYEMQPLASAPALVTSAAGAASYTGVDQREFIRVGVLEGNVVLDENHPYRQITSESCVDIMLDVDELPRKLAEFPAQEGMCLGRCDSPKIINSR